jgi:ATP-dependent helicase/nuclease subunit A
VNLMTVHAAKGLEFPIVFLVNVGRGTGAHVDPILLVSDPARHEPLVSVDGGLPEAEAALRERDVEETKRLLYVAVTRARDRLYFSAVTDGTRFRPARGSLAEVLPASFVEALARAASGDAPQVQGTGPSGTHALQVCRAIVPGRPVLPPAGTLAGASDFGPVADASARARRAATSFDAPPGPLPAAGTDSSRIAGTLVHRLFEQVEAARDEDDEALGRRMRLLLRPAERVGLEDEDGLLESARRCFRAMLRRPSVVALMAAPDRWHEVPFSLAEGGVVVEGTIDSLVRDEAGLVVVELKTGRPAPQHRAQLATYLRAARAFAPGDAVRGVLVYADQDVWLEAHPVGPGA